VADPWLLNYAQTRWETSRVHGLARELLTIGSYMWAWLRWNQCISLKGTLRELRGVVERRRR